MSLRDVSTGATGATAVAPKFSDTLTLFQPGEGVEGADGSGILEELFKISKAIWFVHFLKYR